MGKSFSFVLHPTHFLYFSRSKYDSDWYARTRSYDANNKWMLTKFVLFSILVDFFFVFVSSGSGYYQDLNFYNCLMFVIVWFLIETSFKMYFNRNYFLECCYAKMKLFNLSAPHTYMYQSHNKTRKCLSTNIQSQNFTFSSESNINFNLPIQTNRNQAVDFLLLHLWIWIEKKWKICRLFLFELLRFMRLMNGSLQNEYLIKSRKETLCQKWNCLWYTNHCAINIPHSRWNSRKIPWVWPNKCKNNPSFRTIRKYLLSWYFNSLYLSFFFHVGYWPESKEKKNKQA